MTLTDTFPSGITPGTASAPSDWACVTAGQVVTCNYTPSAAIAAGTSLPNVTIPASVASGASGSLSAVARVSSDDGDPATATDTATVTKLTASASPASSSYGNRVLLSAAGMPAAATGTVSFKSGATTLCSVILPVVSCSTSSTLGAGSYPVTADYSGDANYVASSATTSFTLTKSSAYTMTASASPSTTAYGNGVTLSVSGIPAPATGTVSFKSGATTLCSATIPVVSCATSSALGAGSYPVTATYSGDANYNGSSVGTSFTITKLPTSLNASAAPSSTSYGDTVSLSASGLPGGATGTVTFTSGTTTLSSATIPTLSCTIPPTTNAGSYNVMATYSGDANYNGSSASTSFTLTKSASYSMTASAAPSSTPYTNPVLLSVSGIPGDATGTVTFKTGAATLCTATLPSKSCPTSLTLGAASYSVTAVYSGDANYVGSSAPTSFTITKAATAVNAAATPSSTSYGDTISLSASGLPADATGTITFTSGATTLCTASLPALSCEPPATTSAGSYNVTATYSGDANYTASSAQTSFTLTQSAAYSMTASASPAITPYGNRVTLSVSGIPGDATGVVSFKAGTATLCTATLPMISCLSSATLGVGSYIVTASYPGDGNYEGSSAGTSFTIVEAATILTASASPSSSPYGSPVSLSVSDLPGDATGTVSFTSGAVTLCTTTLPSLSCSVPATTAASIYSVTATYSGDANYNGSSAQTGFTVTKVTGYSMTASATPSSTPHGTSVALLASGIPGDATGTVTFSSGATTLCSASLVQGAASCAVPSGLAAASYPVTATYPGDANHDGSSAQTSFTVTMADATMTASASPSSTSYGETVSVSVAGLPSDATGTVVFTSGATALCTASLPTLSCEPAATLTGGIYPVTATYSGDSNYNGTSAQTSFTVTPSGDYSMTASASPTTTAYGNSVMLSVSGLPLDATGTVSFLSGSATLCASSLPVLSCATSATLGAETYDVTAKYSGDNDYTGSSAGTAFTILKSVAYSMTASAAPDSTPYGQRVLLFVSGLPADATGNIAFSSGTGELCTAILPEIGCETSTSLAAGKYSVTATYSGDANYAGSSAGTSFKITKSSAYLMTASASPTSTSAGNTVQLSVAGLPSDAGGGVTFSAGNSQLCTASLPQLSCNTASSLAAGSYAVTATYSGDANYNGSSAKTSFAITTTHTYQMTATASPSSTTVGNSVSLSVGGIPNDATGSVSFSAGGTTLCAAALPELSCETASSLATGTYDVTATYSGDTNYPGATATTSFTITKVSGYTMTASTNDPTMYGHPVILTVSGIPAGATGTVTFTAGNTTLCTAELPEMSCGTSSSLAVGGYSVTATYSGDPDYAGASAMTSFTITKSSTAKMTAWATPVVAPYGESVMLSASGLAASATGSVVFRWHASVLCSSKVSGGHTSCAVENKLDVGRYEVVAVYGGDGLQGPARASTGFSVIQLTSRDACRGGATDGQARPDRRLVGDRPCQPGDGDGHVPLGREFALHGDLAEGILPPHLETLPASTMR